MAKILLRLRFGRLVVLRRSAQKHWSNSIMWLCQCDCGKKKVIPSKFLLCGMVKSCGCFRRDRLKAGPTHPAYKHGHTPGNGRKVSPTYLSYLAMIARCHRKYSPSYPYVGEKGVWVCLRWLESFENFLADMGPRPEGCTLDRINPFLNYTPDNCCWANRAQQDLNKRADWVAEHEAELVAY